jgi:hypothetical protein
MQSYGHLTARGRSLYRSADPKGRGLPKERACPAPMLKRARSSVV